MVIKNPIQFTIVREVPLDSSGEFWATKVENNGESAITVKPHMNRKVMNRKAELENRNNGDSKQHEQDINNDIFATFFAAKVWDKNPLIKHDIPPDAIIRKEKSGILKGFLG